MLVKRLNIQRKQKEHITEKRTLQIIQKEIKREIITVALLVVGLCEIFNIMSWRYDCEIMGVLNEWKRIE